MAYIPPLIISKLLDINCFDVALRLGLKVRSYRSYCFLHDETKPSLSFHKNGKFWKCFSCGKGGNAINLVMAHENIGFHEACLWLCNNYGIYLPGKSIKGSYMPKIYNNDNFRNIKQQIKVSDNFNREVCEWIINKAGISKEASHFLYEERRFIPQIIESLSIKSITNPVKLVQALRLHFDDQTLIASGWIKRINNVFRLRIYTPCLLIPYYDETNLLCCVQTRFLGSNTNAPRFQFVGSASNILFNAQSLHKLSTGDTLVISEGSTDCMALLSAGYNAIGIPSATTFPLDMLYPLAKYNLMMSVDNDKNQTGEIAFQYIRYAITKAGGSISRINFPKKYKDYSEFYAATKHNNGNN